MPVRTISSYLTTGPQGRGLARARWPHLRAHSITLVSPAHLSSSRRGPRSPWAWGERAELVQQGEPVRHAPVFNDSPVLEPAQVENGECHFVARGGVRDHPPRTPARSPLAEPMRNQTRNLQPGGRQDSPQRTENASPRSPGRRSRRTPAASSTRTSATRPRTRFTDGWDTERSQKSSATASSDGRVALVGLSDGRSDRAAGPY